MKYDFIRITSTLSAGMTTPRGENPSMSGSEGRERLLEWAVWVGALVLLLGLVVEAAAHHNWPSPVVTVLFAGLFVWSENVGLALPSSVTVSPSFLWVLAAVAAFGGHGALLGSAIVGATGGLN